VDITDSEITKLKKMVTAAQEEFDMAVTYHEVWKPAAYDKDLHSRMGQSYASQAFLVMRMALRRETMLALMQLWDRNKQAVRISLIVATIQEFAARRSTKTTELQFDDEQDGRAAGIALKERP
jgi:AbiU2